MVQDAIRARIEEFTRELEGLIREAAMEAVATALGGAVAPGRPVRKASAPAPSPASPGTKLAFKRAKGSKRTPEQLAQIDTAIVAFVKANPGKGVEHMGKALGVPTRDLKLRVLGLLEHKKIKKTGVKRATKYFGA